MKVVRNVAMCSLLFAVAIFPSCTKSSGVGTADGAEVSQTGLVMAQGAPFYRGENPDALEWGGVLDFGVTVKVTGGESVHSVGGDSLRLLPVDLSADAAHLPGAGTVSGWIRSSQYLGGNLEIAAGLAQDARMFKQDGSSIDRLLPRMSLVCLIRSERSSGNFRAHLYDEASDKILTFFVSEGDLTFDKNDIRAAVLIAKAKQTRNEDDKRAILEDAERSFGASDFVSDINAMLRGNDDTAEEAAPMATEELTATFTVRSDGVSVLAEPASDAEAVETLAMDDEVSVVERTIETYTSDGIVARWYKIASPVEGWIFGGNLEGAD